MASAVLPDSRLTDRKWIARGEERTSLPRFLLWLTPWAILLAVGFYAAGLCLYYGLNQTNMDNRFAFGLWIFLDLGIIALGAGAFFIELPRVGWENRTQPDRMVHEEKRQKD